MDKEAFTDRMIATAMGVVLAALVLVGLGFLYMSVVQDREIRCLKAGGESVDGFCFRKTDGRWAMTTILGPDGSPVAGDDPAECDHGITFDEAAARDLSAIEVRKRRSGADLTVSPL